MVRTANHIGGGGGLPLTPSTLSPHKEAMHLELHVDDKSATSMARSSSPKAPLVIHWDRVARLLLAVATVAVTVLGSLLTSALRERTMDICRRQDKPEKYDNFTVVVVGATTIVWMVFPLGCIQAKLSGSLWTTPAKSDCQEKLWSFCLTLLYLLGFMGSIASTISYTAYPCFAAQGLAPFFIVSWLFTFAFIGVPLLALGLYGLSLLYPRVSRVLRNPSLPDVLRIVSRGGIPPDPPKDGV